LEQGFRSRDPQIVLLSLYGAATGVNERSVPFVLEVLTSDEPALQLAALAQLAQVDTDLAHDAIYDAMRSDYLAVRMEAAYWMAVKRMPQATSQLEALMEKADPEAKRYFAELFALEGSEPSMQALRKLLFDADPSVRLEAILHTPVNEADDIGALLRTKARARACPEQEALAIALGELHDAEARTLLEQIALSAHGTARLSALFSLARLGDVEALRTLEQEAERGNCFAISSLGALPSCTKAVLIEAMQHADPEVRVNATMALLQQRDARALVGIREILVDDPKDCAFQPASSPGGALSYTRVTRSAAHNLRDMPMAYEWHVSFREQVLIQAVELPHADFLQLARTLFDYQAHELIPLLCRLLENIRTPEAIELLQFESQRLGDPFIRSYAHLALFRMNADPAYRAHVTSWIRSNQGTAIFPPRPLLPWRVRLVPAHFQLTLEEKSRLFVESLEAIAQCQDEEAIETLLFTLQQCHETVRPIAAGLLLRAAV